MQRMWWEQFRLMVDHRNTWRDSTEVFQRQLDLNKRQLELDPSSPDYPPHWKNFRELMMRAVLLVPIKRVLDIGCGCGAFSEILNRHYPHIEYTGMDYSKQAIELARTTWNRNFKVKNLWDITPEDVKGYDMIHSDGLFEVLPDGDKALKHILSLGASSVFLNRVQNGPAPDHHKVYEAYGFLPTYSYFHNREGMLNCMGSKYKFPVEISNPPYSTFFLWGLKS